MFNTIKHIVTSKNIRKKLLFTIAILILYRFFVVIPVPFVDIDVLAQAKTSTQDGMEFFAMLMGGSLSKFSIVALGLIPFINSSIMIQLLSIVVPKLEEIKEEGESGNMKIQQYTRRLTLPLAFLQSIGMVYLISSYINGIIDTSNFGIVLGAAFSLTVGTVLLIRIGEMITEKGTTNGISLLIFASIVSGISSSFLKFMGTDGANLMSVFVFILLILLVLVFLAILLIRTKKEIPITYSRAGKIQETAVLPIPLNPVGMIPIIFSMAFVSFPYLLGNILGKFNTPGTEAFKSFVNTYLNLYTSDPHYIAVGLYFILIILFTFFYSWIMFKPEKMAEQIQKRGGYIPGIRPGEDTEKYIGDILSHLSLWGGIGLGLIGIYTYVINWIPFIKDAISSGGLNSVPVVVSGAGIVIVVGVVQELINKINADLLMEKYSKIV